MPDEGVVARIRDRITLNKVMSCIAVVFIIFAVILIAVQIIKMAYMFIHDGKNYISPFAYYGKQNAPTY